MTMTTNPAALAQVIARHKAAQAALDAVPRDVDYQSLREEGEALDDLAFTPCASDAEFLEKLRYIYTVQARIWPLPDNGDGGYGALVIAAACHFCPVNA